MRKDMPDRIKNKIIDLLINKTNNKHLLSNTFECDVDGYHKINFNWRELFELITLRF